MVFERKAILRTVRAWCGWKAVDRKMTEEQMDMLGLKETVDGLATAIAVRWYDHVLRRSDDSVITVGLDLEVSGKRKRGQSKKTWNKQAEEETEKIGLKKVDALNQAKKCEMECKELWKREIQFFKTDFVCVNAGSQVHLVLLDSS